MDFQFRKFLPLALLFAAPLTAQPVPLPFEQKPLFIIYLPITWPQRGKLHHPQIWEVLGYCVLDVRIRF